MDINKSNQKPVTSNQNLKNKRILITAGPTWVPIDSVRVISNIATGETGIILAQKLRKAGCKVTLLLGPVGNYQNKKIRLLRFRFFEELKAILKRELCRGRYDIVIHSAAVSDYKPKKSFRRKLVSSIKNLKIDLIPAEKIIDLIKRTDNSLFLAGFKFEPDINKEKLLAQARELMKRSACDLVVANTLRGGRYSAYLVRSDKVQGPLYTKKKLAEQLIKNL
ncbi:MAG: phosphopantothenoylcysteine decarboxylase [Candidatus Omnitrophota bacterium]|nr:phosphopantothenoylcysteine decarboxylase [Candidatus Omnitrophota bacterium]